MPPHLIANPDLIVVVHGGDGDLMGKGAGHFVALWRNSWSDNFNLDKARQLLWQV